MATLRKSAIAKTFEPIRPQLNPRVYLFCAHGQLQKKLRLKAGDITNAYFQGKPLEAPQYLKGVPDREINECGYMIARVPVYGTFDAGRNLYLRMLDTAKTSGCIQSKIIPALYYALTARVNFALCYAHMLMIFFSSRGEVQSLLDAFRIGKIEQGTWGFVDVSMSKVTTSQFASTPAIVPEL